jgi:phospholipid/cholesterol/gamma-HCH transport system substrate-binding protein
VANRYISLTLGANNAPDLDEGATLSGSATTAPVDLDQLFDAFTPKTRRGLQQVIQGFAAIYSGKGHQSNVSYKYFAPSITSTDRLLKEIDFDEHTFEQFLIQGGRAMAAIAERRDDLSSLVSNANQALGAIASQSESFDAGLQLLPPTLRQANTTFVNLRGALDDVDPLINTAKPATENLAPFLRRLRPVAARAVPVFQHLSEAVYRPGPDNDLASLLRSLVPLQRRGRPASRSGVRALDASQPTISFARAYSPDLLGAVSKLGQVSGYYDADGHYARVQAAAFNLFRWDPNDSLLKPIAPSEKFDGFDTLATTARCPGAATQPISGSNPFLDQGRLGPGDCDTSDVPPGP